MKLTFKTFICLLISAVLFAVLSVNCFASYGFPTHSVEIVAGEGGSTYSYTGKYEFARNEWVLIICDPDDINNEVDTYRVYEKETGKEITAKYNVAKDSYFANVGFYMGDHDVVVEITYKFTDNPFYNITVDSNKDDPDVKLNRKQARAGDRITVDPEVYEGIRAKEVTYIIDGEYYPAKSSTSGIFSFDMPAGDTVVYVDYYPNTLDSHDVRTLLNDNGFLEIEKNRYIPGDTVVVTTHADTERCVTGLEYYSQQKGYEVRGTAENAGNGTFTFTMPDYDIFLLASYGKPDKNTVIDIETRYDIIDDINEEYGNIVCIHDRAYEGDEIEFAINVKEDCYLKSVNVIANKTGDILPCNYNQSRRHYSFIMPASSVAISVMIENREFMEKYNISIFYDKKGGSVTALPEEAVEGERVYFIATPKNGYMLTDVEVRNITSDSIVNITLNNGKYSFNMPDGEVEINVKFEEEYVEKYYDIELEYDSFFGDAAISLDSATEGEKVYVYVEPDDGVSVDSIYVRGEETDSHINVKNGGDKSYFYMPDESVVVTVTFEEIDTESKDSIDENIEAEKDPELETEPPAPTVHICPAKAYFDVDTNAWYHDAVDYVILSGLMGGYSESTFAPEDTTTRAMIATILWRVEGSPTPATANTFTDVANNMWYTNAVIWASEKGIVNGVGNDMFDPNGKITREQLAAMVYRYAKYKGDTREPVGNISNYPDSVDVSDWAIDALVWCNNYGVVNIRDGLIAPKRPAQRAEAAFAVWRISD